MADITVTVVVERGPAGAGGGDMKKIEYDTTGNGVVDDAEKLGGQLPGTYATSQDLLTHQNSQANPHAVTLEQARTAGGDLQGDISMNESRIRNLPSALNGDEPVIKADHDAAMSNVGRNRGSIDASTNPNYPASAVGDRWEISVAGKIGGAAGVNVQVWDEVVCKVESPGGDQATVGAHFYTIQGNVDKADEDVLGMVERATQPEVDAEADQERYITPFRLGQWLVNVLTRALTFSGYIFFSKKVRTSEVNLGNVNGVVELDLAGGVENTFHITANGNITGLTFSNPPASGMVSGLIYLKQDATGNRTVALGANTRGEITVNTAANSLTILAYSYSAIDTKMFVTANKKTTAV